MCVYIYIYAEDSGSMELVMGKVKGNSVSIYRKREVREREG